MKTCSYVKCHDNFVPKNSRQKYCSSLCCGYAARARWISSHGGRKNIPALVRRDFSIGKRFSVLKFAAKSRGLVVELTRAQYAEIVSHPCFWCGDVLPKTGGGIDRRDNSKDYIFENSVPCCTQCNNGKSDSSEQDFMNWVSRVYEKHGRGRED